MEPNDVKSKLEDIEEEEVKPDVEEALQRLRAAVPEPKNRVKKEEDAEEAPARLLASDAVEDREAMNVDSGAGAVEADVGAVEDVAVKVLSSAGQEDTSTGHGGRSSAHPSTKYQKTSRTVRPRGNCFFDPFPSFPPKSFPASFTTSTTNPSLYAPS
ncbi:hypothetical protein JCM10213v2_009029 [Rhodosporidiobolus nylandii]